MGNRDDPSRMHLSEIELELLEGEDCAPGSLSHTPLGDLSPTHAHAHTDAKHVHASPSKSKKDAFSHKALKLPQLRAVKDGLLIEVSELLGVDLFSAGALLALDCACVCVCVCVIVWLLWRVVFCSTPSLSRTHTPTHTHQQRP
jgi:hypothetical protein